jgi:hypothetical protein
MKDGIGKREIEGPQVLPRISVHMYVPYVVIAAYAQ